MGKRVPSRKDLFLAALRLEGMTVEEWAARQPNTRTGRTGVSSPHLYMVLHRRVKSGPLNGRIDGLIRKHFPNHNVAA